jgi:hypothetical protein
MLGFFVWLILFVILSLGLFALHYWLHLFRFKDSYTRNELLNFTDILRGELRLITDADIAGATLFLIGIAFGWLCILFGGLLSPDRLQAPDFSEDFATNYFFQSLLFPVLLQLLWPSFEDIVEKGPLARVIRRKYPLLIGLTLTLSPAGVAFWGSYYHLTFLWVFLNMILLSAYSLLLLEFKERVIPEEESGSRIHFTGDEGDSPLETDNDLEI